MVVLSSGGFVEEAKYGNENEDRNEMDADSGGGFVHEVVSKYGPAADRRFVNALKLLSLAPRWFY